MSEMLPSEEMMNEKQENQESEIDAVVSPISSPPYEDYHPSHFNNDLQNEESTISADKTENQESELKYMFSKVEERGKRPMSESYELKPINKPTFSNLEQGGTSENESMKEDEYDYDLDLAILKSIYHYFFNHGVIPYPYSENFINYIEASISNLKFHGQELVTKILALEHQFFSIMEITAGHYPDIIHPVFREIFYLSMGLWGYSGDYYPVDNVDVITRNKERDNEESFNQFLDEENRKQEKLQALKKGKRPMSELYEFQHIVPTFSNPGLEAGTSENVEEDYDYDQDLAILKSMYQYCFNHGGKIPYPISRELINYIEALVPNLKVRGQELETKIVMLESDFLVVMTMAGGFDPDKSHLVYHEIFYLSMGLWGYSGDYYPVDNVDVITRNKERDNEESFNQFLDEENRKQEKLQALKKGKRPMSELYEFQHIVPTFSNPGLEAGTSENVEEDYDYDQDLAILKSMYQYCFNHGGKIPYPISRELINYIEALVPNLKVRGQELETKIVMLESDFLVVMTMAGGFDPDKSHLVYHEIFYLSMG
uniref:Uncharacterized protein n=1 Tax=Solanum tuberosum TaxID=4113 RepID=M1E154_SOLTU